MSLLLPNSSAPVVPIIEPWVQAGYILEIARLILTLHPSLLLTLCSLQPSQPYRECRPCLLRSCSRASTVVRSPSFSWYRWSQNTQGVPAVGGRREQEQSGLLSKQASPASLAAFEPSTAAPAATNQTDRARDKDLPASHLHLPGCVRMYA